MVETDILKRAGLLLKGPVSRHPAHQEWATVIRLLAGEVEKGRVFAKESIPAMELASEVIKNAKERIKELEAANAKGGT